MFTLVAETTVSLGSLDDYSGVSTICAYPHETPSPQLYINVHKHTVQNKHVQTYRSISTGTSSLDIIQYHTHMLSHKHINYLEIICQEREICHYRSLPDMMSLSSYEVSLNATHANTEIFHHLNGTVLYRFI